MKTLNQKSTHIFNKLIARLDKAQHVRINNAHEAFMPLSVEYLFTTDIVGRTMKVFSLAHYYLQNGDLVPDPEMTFAIYTPVPDPQQPNPLPQIYPMSFQNALMYDEAIFQKEGKWQYIPSRLNDLIYFANIWLKNIQDQQNI
ncbi:MAG: hypothetical protein CVT92_09670 [Bacteroidetes bacterium HGW-Bacteroidetes-1]|jgi:hypothetical protein|nr:MAG: hypothetical protein CVT92_09670 [Bacteroidetes bacterium HGW-Bacteroidetes-1]